MSDQPQSGPEDPNAPKDAQKPPQATPAAQPFYMRLPFLGGVFIAIVAIVAVAYFASRTGESGAGPEAKAEAANDVAGAVGWELGRKGDIVMGSRDAPVKLVEYASLTCGHCAAFKLMVFPDIKKKYIDTGLVQYTIREFPTAPQGLAVRAFMLARCTGEDHYYQALEALFRTQALWIRPDPQEARGALEKISRQFGLNDTDFNTCIGDEEEFQRIRTVAEAGYKLYGINATPSFVINGRKAEIHGATFEALDSVIRDHLPEGTKVPDYTPSEFNRAAAPDDDKGDGAEDEGSNDDAADDDGAEGDDEGSDDDALGDDAEESKKTPSDDDDDSDNDSDDDDGAPGE